MKRKYVVKFKQRLALLLVMAFILHPATAFAVEKTDISAQETDVQVSGLSVVSEDDSEIPGDIISAPEAAVSGEEAACTDVSSEETILGADIVSDDSTHSMENGLYECITYACDRMNSILSEKTVRAAIYGCDECELKSEPSKEGQTVRKLSCATTVELLVLSANAEGFWFEVRACLGETEAFGFIPKKNVICVDEDYVNLEKELALSDQVLSSELKDSFRTVEDLAKSSIDSFPENYRDKLYALNAAHPNWVFVPQNLGGLTLDGVVNGEYSNRDRNWIYYTAPDAYKEGLTKDTSKKWYYASKSCITYYMNPLNFLDDSHIFQFEQLAYNSSCHTEAGVQSILNGTFMAGKIEDDTLTYAQAFMKIGKELGLSPYHLSSRVRLEQGVQGNSPLISGTYPGYVGYYNYFNIKASDPNKVENGLKYAKDQGWDTRYKSLRGGAAFLGNGYISAGQDTLYLEKFDLVGTLYTHQYMQNIQAPSSEAVTTYKQYSNAGSINNPFIFKIPVYSDASSGGSTGTDQLDNQKIQTTFKLIKSANLFCSEDSEESLAKYSINSNAEIYGVKTSEKTALNAGTNPYFEVVGLSGNILTLKTKNRNSGNSQSTYKKEFVIIASNAGEFEASFNVSTLKSAPSMKASAAVIYDGFENGVVELTDNKGASLSLPEDVKVSTEDTGISCSISADGGWITVSPNDSFKPGSKTFKLESAEWVQPVSVKAQVKKGSIPALKLSVKSVKLNTRVPMEQYGTVNVRAGINGSGISLNDLKIAGSNEKTIDALNSGLSAVFDKDAGIIRLGVKEGKAQKGSYSLVLEGTVKNPAGEDITLKSVKMTVSVIEKEKEKALTLRNSGRINLVDRADSCITCTPVFSGTGSERIAKIEQQEGTGFKAVLLRKGSVTPDGKAVNTDSGIIVIQAVSGTPLNRSEAYSFGIGVILDNGLKIDKTVTIRPVQTAAKVYGNIITAAMTRSSSTSRNYVIKSKGLTKDDTVIESVVPDFGDLSDYFSYKADAGQGTGREFSGLFELKDKTIKDGTYSLRFNVYLKDRGGNTAPVRVILKVRIR